MENYGVGSFLIKIKNAAMARNKEISDKATKSKLAVARVMEKLGFIEGVKVEKGIINLSLTLSHKEPVLMNLKLVSKPGRRVYAKIAEIEAKKGPSVYIISTPKGIISSVEAKKLGVGGEIIAEVW